jgi:hypothetical protein
VIGATLSEGGAVHFLQIFAFLKNLLQILHLDTHFARNELLVSVLL